MVPFRLNCLEVGSGSGVCGMALAHALNSCVGIDDLDAATILLTDRGERAVDSLAGNIRRNLPTLMGHGCDDADKYRITIAAESLVWGDDLHSTTTKFHLIIGSDLLYNTQESYDPLVTTIKRHLCHERGIVMLAVRWRKPDLERAFFQKAEREGLRFELWDELANDDDFGGRRCPCGLDWTEYGDPESDASNGYFHERTISVAGTNKSLGCVTERDMESMSDEEYSAFDELQVQVYIGKYHGEGGATRSQKRQRNERRGEFASYPTPRETSNYSYG
jgi:predicted nicotinamide N-methyase